MSSDSNSPKAESPKIEGVQGSPEPEASTTAPPKTPPAEDTPAFEGATENTNGDAAPTDKKGEEDNVEADETRVVSNSKKRKKSLAGDEEYAMVLEDLVLASGSNKILRGVTLAVPTGVLYGILGESGAGKTTLLRLIARKLDETVLTITGKGFLPSEIWYIAQEDVLYEYDTPRRAVTFLHRLLHGSTTADADRVAEELLELVKFPMGVIDQPIGTTDSGLSVGSRRLLNVAMALCAKAKVIMLDEPTTGLDSTSAANLVKTIADICHRRGLTAICTIHQPSDDAFQHFDHVTVMSEGQPFIPNKDAPIPSVEDADQFSRAELLMLQMKERSLNPATLPEEWSPTDKDAYLEKASFHSQLEKLQATGDPPFLRQVALLTERTFYRNWANIFALRFRFVISLALFILLGFCFFQLPYDDPAFLRDHIGLWTAIIGCTFVPIVLAAGFFPAEKPSFVHEVSQSKRPGILPVTIARTFYDTFAALVCSVAVLVAMAIIGVESKWGEFWFTFVLQTMCSDSFGLSLSIRFPPEVSIGAMIPGIGFFSVLCGTGLVIPPKDGAGWIYHVLKWVTFFKYGFAGIAQGQLESMTGNCIPLFDESCTYPNGAAAIEALELETEGFLSTIGFNWMMLIILFLAFRVLIFLQFLSLRAASKFSYKAATNWEEKKQKDKERQGGDGSAVDIRGENDDTEDGVVETPQSHVVSMTPQAGPIGTPQVESTRNPLTAEEGKEIFGGEDSDIDFVLAWDLDVTATHREGLTKVTRNVLPKQKGYAKSGEVMGILGPGSSGKTALLKALSGFLPISGYVASESHIEVACQFNCDLSCKPAIPGVRFVYQYDAFVAGDTVNGAIVRQLEFAMKDPKERHEEICASIVKSMGLAHVATKKASEISGGQMRRLSIACQLAHRPRILLLDEPTSGLDSELALECMLTLKDFALKSNSVVICTLNQPGKRLLPTVDTFLYMQEGDAVFQGSLEATIECFNLNREEDRDRIPTDVILERLRETYTVQKIGTDPSIPPEEVEEFTLDKALTKTRVAPRPWNLTNVTLELNVENRYKANTGFGSLLLTLMKRNITSRTENPIQYGAEMIFKFIMYPVLVSIMFAQVDDPFLGSRFGINFLILACMSFMCFVTPVVLFALERNVYEREARAGDYHAVTYVLARWFTETLPDVVLCIIGFIVMYFIVGFEGNLPLFFGVGALCYLYAYGLGSILAVLPLPLFVNCGFAAFSVVCYMLGSDLIVTPHQIDRIKFVHMLEVIAPVRFAAVLQIRDEASTSAFGADALLGQMGLNRKIDEEWIIWICFGAGLVLFRIVALAFASFIIWLDSSTVRSMHPKEAAKKK